MDSRTLVVAATTLEIAPSLLRETGTQYEGLGSPGALIQGRSCDFLISGVGQLLCGVHVARVVSARGYDRVIQAGIGGSFDSTLKIGSVVVVAEEVLADLGAEDHGSFLDLFDMGLLHRDEHPFTGGVLRSPAFDFKVISPLRRVRSATVNRVLSEEHSIAWVKGRYQPEVVNMEGAAFFYACLCADTPFLSLRAISDMVGPRDKSTWNIPQAVSALDAVLAALIQEVAEGGR
jgi:futalosine hydrolase